MKADKSLKSEHLKRHFKSRLFKEDYSILVMLYGHFFFNHQLKYSKERITCRKIMIKFPVRYRTFLISLCESGKDDWKPSVTKHRPRDFENVSHVILRRAF